jgi:hypothetical protein
MFLRLPVEFDLGILFRSLPLLLIEQMDPENPLAQGATQGAQDVGQTVLGAASALVPNPSVAEVPLALGLNRDPFTTNPIESPFQRITGVPRQLRGRERASSAAVLLSDVTEGAVSPAQADFLARRVLGRWGPIVTQTLEEPLSDFIPIRAGASKPAQNITEAPILTGFFTSDRSLGQLDDRFREAYEKDRKELNLWKGLTDPFFNAGIALPDGITNTPDINATIRFDLRASLKEWISDQNDEAARLRADRDRVGDRVLRNNLNAIQKSVKSAYWAGTVTSEAGIDKLIEEGEIEPGHALIARMILKFTPE